MSGILGMVGITAALILAIAAVWAAVKLFTRAPDTLSSKRGRG